MAKDKNREADQAPTAGASGVPKEAGVPKEVIFHYQKSNHFRVIHVDGAYGGISPNGFLHFALYNERGAIPKISKIDLSPEADRTDTVVDTLGGYVREVEIDVIMDINAASSFYRWLKGKLETLGRSLNIPEKEWKQMMGEADD